MITREAAFEKVAFIYRASAVGLLLLNETFQAVFPEGLTQRQF